MSTYLKNMEGCESKERNKEKFLKRTEDELESDKSKKAESSEKRAEGSRKKSFVMRLLMKKLEDFRRMEHQVFLEGLLGHKDFKMILKLLLLSTAGIKVNAAGLQLLEELLQSEG
ncbi:hypothetical protein Tco_0047575 [Tanacetum coccineum]